MVKHIPCDALCSRILYVYMQSHCPGSDTSLANFYNGDDARHFPRQMKQAHDCYSKAAHEFGCLEFCLEATQAALSGAEGETSTVLAMLVDANATIAGWVFLPNRTFSF